MLCDVHFRVCDLTVSSDRSVIDSDGDCGSTSSKQITNMGLKIHNGPADSIAAVQSFTTAVAAGAGALLRGPTCPVPSAAATEN